ncbi:hypothetical protein LguiB_031668 [Lonicera macranthoides]
MVAVESERNMEINCGEEQGFPKTAIEARKIIEKGIKALQCLDRIILVNGIQSLRHEFCVQVLESIGMKYNIRERSQDVRIQRHGPREEAIDENKFFTEPRDNVRAELKIDSIGVDRFDVHLNFLLIEFFNKLRWIAL